MSRPNTGELKDILKQAAEAVEELPENLQAAAFDKAVDLLTRTDEKMLPAFDLPKQKPKGKTSPQPRHVESEVEIGELLHAIDSTKYPEIGNAKKALDRSLFILRLALHDFGIDGLTTGDIARILTEKFRISTNANAVNMACANAADLVNRIPHGQGYLYRIMEPGESYLAELKNSGLLQQKPTAKQTVKKRRRSKKKTASTTKTSGAMSQNKKTSSRSGGKSGSAEKIGPKAAVLNMLEQGYFKIARTGPEVQEELKKKRGLSYDTDSLRMAMLRLIREEKLERDTDEDGQYEYKKPDS